MVFQVTVSKSIRASHQISKDDSFVFRVHESGQVEVLRSQGGRFLSPSNQLLVPKDVVRRFDAQKGQSFKIIEALGSLYLVLMDKASHSIIRDRVLDAPVSEGWAEVAASKQNTYGTASSDEEIPSESTDTHKKDNFKSSVPKNEYTVLFKDINGNKHEQEIKSSKLLTEIAEDIEKVNRGSTVIYIIPKPK